MTDSAANNRRRKSIFFQLFINRSLCSDELSGEGEVMSTRTTMVLAIAVLVGCEQKAVRVQEIVDSEPVKQAESAVEPEKGLDLQIDLDLPAENVPETAAAAETAVDPFYVLERLRETTSRPEWGIAQTPTLWSTLTVDFGLPFPEDAADRVWAKWTEPKTALTIEANQQIKSEIEQAVAEAVKKQDRVERTFECKGFEFFVVASAVPDKDMSFVRISFQGLQE